MIQIGIRLHDVNTTKGKEEQTLEKRAARAREEGFSCVHLAPQKVIAGVRFEGETMHEGMGHYFRRVFAKNDLDISVLGCYMNLATPDDAQLEVFKQRYYGSLRVARAAGAAMVGTETGNPNRENKPDRNTRTKDAFDTFVRNAADVAAYAEAQGVTFAIEPVWTHIVYDADKALEMLKAIQSPNLRIILDPVNLLGVDNCDDRERIIGDAMEKLCPYIAMVHIKDFRRENGKFLNVAAGTGEMDYTSILRFMKARKPYIQATLENTDDTNAEKCRRFIRDVYDGL
ncbi:MAG: sugar phosphate isomerase/epimerase [Clostridiales bacterium]|nr:sugar phosphate isomerase/epimerase [Clostridiales bacterium]